MPWDARAGAGAVVGLLVLAGLPVAAAEGCAGPGGPGGASLCPLLDGVVASCLALGAVVVHGNELPVGPAAGGAAAAAVAGEGAAFDSDAAAEVVLPLGLVEVRARGLHAQCAAEAQKGDWTGPTRAAAGWSRAAAVEVTHGFGTLAQAHGVGFARSATAFRDSLADESRCELAGQQRPFGGGVPCPPGALALPQGARLRLGPTWGPVAVPGSSLVVYAGAAAHVAAEGPEGPVHAYLGFVAVAVAPSK